MPDLIISGILLGPIIVALVQLLKHYGLSSDWAPVANLILSACAGLLVLFVQAKPEYSGLVVLFLQVLILFLMSAGYYTTGKWLVEKANGEK